MMYFDNYFSRTDCLHIFVCSSAILTEMTCFPFRPGMLDYSTSHSGSHPSWPHQSCSCIPAGYETAPGTPHT